MPTLSINGISVEVPPGTTILEAAKSALISFMQDVPCESRLGLGVFSERISFLLIEPTEICKNYDALEGAISGLDWRMAWEGDSRISAGFFRAIAMARELKSDLLFFSDGQEAPPLLDTSGEDRLHGKLPSHGPGIEVLPLVVEHRAPGDNPEPGDLGKVVDDVLGEAV